MPLVEALERVITRAPQELPVWALHIQQSYQMLMRELYRSQTDQDLSADGKTRSIDLVYRRVLNLRQTILSEGGEIQPIFKAGSADNDMALIFFEGEGSLKKIPEGWIGTEWITGRILVNNQANSEIVPPQEWCGDPRIVRGVAKGFLSELPRGIRTTIKYS